MESTVLALGIFEMVEHSSFMARVVLGILLLFSVASWTIIVHKFVTFHLARRDDNRFLAAFGQRRNWNEMHNLAKELRFSAIARVFAIGYAELLYFRDAALADPPGNGKQGAERTCGCMLSLADLKSVGIAMDGAINHEVERLGSSLNFVATTGSTTPFIGLFGTVWGIMYSFRVIGVKGSASIGNVAPGIAEALIATAAGLLVAIPAVIFYNFLSGRIKWFTSRMDNFLHNFLCQAEKNFIHKPAVRSEHRISAS